MPLHMPLSPDTKLGPYKVIGIVGSGGMGEVYRARDARLQRDVALKILPASFTSDQERLRRFEQEGRAIAALNHPNIVSVYDVGTSDGVPFIVSELLEGETLRSRLNRSTLPSRKAIEFALQLARGLAAAHDQGVVHRDLKPENIFVTRNELLKILDFGLAKLRRPESSGETIDGITVAHTSTGQVMGTAAYMSPEQVRGDVVDHRSDIFSFGAILYEMLAGQRAFQRKTSAETMTAILNEEPAEVPPTTVQIPPVLDRIVRHCMEKNPPRRFYSAHDIAFDLESLSQSSTSSPTVKPVSTRLPWLRIAAIALLAAAVVGVGYSAWHGLKSASLHPKLRRITFRRGTIWNARFTPDGNLIYGAAWEGRPEELFAAEKGSTESRPLGLQTTDILSVSPTGELAVSTNRHFVMGFESAGMLARAPLGGGAPRDIADAVEYADWAPDSASLAIIRRVGGKVRLEYPLGKVLYETAGWASHPRVSPDGKLVAFIDHPYERDDDGLVAIVDQSGNKKTLTGEFVSAQGLAWLPGSDEIWFTATTSGSSRELHAVTLSGKERLIYLGTGTLTLHDISKEGHVLFSRDDLRAGIIGLAPGENKERDLSWHDWSVPRDLSDSGKLVSFDETGEAGGETGGLYVRGTDGSPAVRLGDGRNPSLSPDGKHALALTAGARRGLIELPTGAGESRTISTGDIRAHQAYFFPDEQHILLVGNAPGSHALRLWIEDIAGGNPRAISPEGSTISYRSCISPDGRQIAAQDPEGLITIYPVSGGSPISVPSVQAGDVPIQWTPDGKSLLVGRREVPTRVFTIDLTSGERKLFRSFSPADATGLFSNAPPDFSRDLKAYVYTYQRITSDLYIVDGLK